MADVTVTGERPDLRRARADLAYFAALVGHPLTAAQARALACERRTTVIVAHRQAGKSRSLAVYAAWCAFRRRDQTVLLVSASEAASRELLRKVRAVIAHPLLAGAVVDEAASRVALSNGSRIIAVAASSPAIRGLSVDVLILDEAAFLSEDVMVAAVGTTAARPDARVVMASTPWTASGVFYEHAMAGDSEHQGVFWLRLEDSPWVTPGFMEQMTRTLSPDRLAAEYFNQFGGSGANFLGSRLVLRSRVDVLLPEWGPIGAARPFAGLDYGSVNDASVLGLFARLAGVHQLNPGLDPRRPVYVAWTRPWPLETTLSEVAGDVAGQPVAYALVSSETNGIGRGPSEDLGGRLPASPREPREARGGLLAARSSAVGGGRSARSMPRLVNELEGDRDPLVFELERRRHLARMERGLDAPPVTLFNPSVTTMESKALAYERIRRLLENDQLLLPNEPELLRQMTAIRGELTANGGLRIGAPGAGHDDHPDSLMIASGVYRDRRGRLVCALSQHADRPTPTAEVPDLDEPVVTSGSGLRVYARPPLQSVVGRGVSLPPGVRVRPVPEDPRWGPVRSGVAAALRGEDLTNHTNTIAPDGAEGSSTYARG
ncbi:MAG: terminase family protein [Solirubrobacteraceae bacterium]